MAKDEIVIEMDNGKNGNVEFPPARQVFRCRYEVGDLPAVMRSNNGPARAYKKPIPGFQIVLDIGRRCAAIVDPLTLPENAELLEHVNAVLKGHSTGVATEQAAKGVSTQRFRNLTDTDIATWHYWMQRGVKEHWAVLRQGQFLDQAKLKGRIVMDFYVNPGAGPRYLDDFERIDAGTYKCPGEQGYAEQQAAAEAAVVQEGADVRISMSYPETPLWPKWSWVADAARALGHEVRIVRDLASLRAADAEDDLVLFSQQGAAVHPGAIIAQAKEHRAFWCQWCFNLNAMDRSRPLEKQVRLSSPDGRPNMHLLMARAMDLVLVKEGNLLDEYRRIGINASYLDQGCPSWMGACEHREVPEWDVLIWANGVWPERRRDVARLVEEGFSVAWAGESGGCKSNGCLSLPVCPCKNLPALASRAACVLSVDKRHDLDGYHSDRTWLALGMGACVLRRRFQGMPDGMEERCLVYDDHGRMLSLVLQAHRDRAWREEVGRRAREWTMAGHTYEHRIEEIVRLCNDRKVVVEPAGEPVV